MPMKSPKRKRKKNMKNNDIEKLKDQIEYLEAYSNQIEDKFRNLLRGVIDYSLKILGDRQRKEIPAYEVLKELTSIYLSAIEEDSPHNTAEIRMEKPINLR